MLIYAASQIFVRPRAEEACFIPFCLYSRYEDRCS